MATGTIPSNSELRTVESPALEDFIEQQVQRTQACVRLVDILGAVMTLAALVLGYLMFMVLVDHWMIFGGLGTWGRTLSFLGLAAITVGYAFRTLWPYCLHRINPIYAARALEQAQPTLKNSLVNFLLLQRQHVGVSEAVYHGVQQQAAAGLHGLTAESAVDRHRLTRVGCTLVGVLAVAAIYLALSPKSPLKSAARVLVPWARIAPVTRVQIDKVLPGSGETSLGQPVKVTAEIRGLKADEPVTLHYSTLDDQVEGQTVPMYRQNDELVHSAQLPPDPAGPQRDLAYRIEAGDAVAGPFVMRVVPAPTIQIERIEYQYPAYTGLASRSVERLGDIKAIEGTKVVIHALASHPIDTASVQLEGLRGQTRPMQSRGELAARFDLPLRLVQVGGRREPEFTSYRMRLTSQRGDHNRDPVTYQIEVTPDVGPQVDIVEPAQREVKLPADRDLTIEVRGRDADYALSDLRLVGLRDSDTVLDEPLLKGEPKPWNRTYRLPYHFVPAELKLQPGDEVRLRAVAVDNKSPEPNRAESPEYHIVITEPENPAAGKQGAKGENSKQGDGKQESKGQQNPQDNKAGGADSGQEKSGEKGGKSEDGKSGEKSDGGNSSGEKSPSDSAKGEKEGGQKSSSDKGGEKSNDTKNQSGKSEGGGESKQRGDAGERSPEAKQGGNADSQQADGKSDSAQADSGQAGQGSKSKSGKSESGKTQAGKPQASDGSGEGGNEPIDNEGDAIAELLKQVNQNRDANPKDGKGQPQPDQQASDNQKPGEQKQGDKQAGSNPLSKQNEGGASDADKQLADNQPRENRSADKQAGGKPSGQNQADAKQGDQSATNKSEAGQRESAKQGMGEKGTSDKQADPKQDGTKKDGANKAGNKSGAEKSGTEKSPADKQRDAKQGGQPPGSEKLAGEKPSGDKQSTGDKPGEKQDVDKSPHDKQGSQPPPSSEQKSGPPSGNSQGHEQQGSQPEGSQKADEKPSGGQEGEHPVGSEASKAQEKPSTPNGTPGQKQSPSDSTTTDQDSQNPPNQRPSDTQSSQNGDKAGKGPQGSGQQQKGAGQGAAGTSQSAEEGGSKSEQSGMGEQGNRAGDKQKSDQATGQHGNKPGNASPGAPDKQPGSKPEGNKNEQPPAGADPNSKQGSEAGKGQANNGGPPSGAPGVSKGSNGDPQPPGNAVQPSGQGDDHGPGSDEANLDYARKSTDLAISYLQDQLDKGQIDPNLRKRFGWTEEEFRSLLRRLEANRDRATRSGADQKDRQAYEEWLRSLGLHPPGGAIKTGRAQQQRLPGAKDDAQVTVPSILREQHEAYRQGIIEQSRPGE